MTDYADLPHEHRYKSHARTHLGPARWSAEWVLDLHLKSAGSSVSPGLRTSWGYGPAYNTRLHRKFLVYASDWDYNSWKGRHEANKTYILITLVYSMRIYTINRWRCECGKLALEKSAAISCWPAGGSQNDSHPSARPSKVLAKMSIFSTTLSAEAQIFQKDSKKTDF